MTNTIDSGSYRHDIPQFNRRVPHSRLTCDTGQGLIELALTLPRTDDSGTRRRCAVR